MEYRNTSMIRQVYHIFTEMNSENLTFQLKNPRFIYTPNNHLILEICTAFVACALATSVEINFSSYTRFNSGYNRIGHKMRTYYIRHIRVLIREEPPGNWLGPLLF
jgi:hypothetical protein